MTYDAPILKILINKARENFIHVDKEGNGWCLTTSIKANNSNGRIIRIYHASTIEQFLEFVMEIIIYRMNEQ